MTANDTAPPTPQQLDSIFDSCSNRGRWGDDDELGTLNLIDATARRRAAALVQEGTVVRLGRPLPMAGSTVATHPVVHRMLAGPADAALDTLDITTHDPQITHLDALGHTYLRGTTYNHRRQAEVQTATGLTTLSVATMRDGIFTRGVLLDIAAARGVDHLAADAYVTAADLDAAERSAGVTVSAGDAVIVHVGRAERLAAESLTDFPVPRAGLHADAMPWLRDRDVAVFLGDCTERLPGEAAPIALPLHQIGAVSMGLCLIDGALTSQLVLACRAAGRYEFLFCCTVPEVIGATGFAVNPICLF